MLWCLAGETARDRDDRAAGGHECSVTKGVVGKVATLGQVFLGVFCFVGIDLVVVAAMIAFPNLVN